MHTTVSRLDPWPPAIVLGGSIGALSFARSLGRRGIPVTCLGTDAHAPAARSRYASYRAMGDVRAEEDRWLEALSGMGREPRGAILPTSDDTLLFASRHAEELSGSHALNVPRQETVATILDKKLQYRVAEGAGIPVPRTLYPDEEGIEKIAGKVEYPCLLKPRHSRIWRHHAGTKLTEVSSPEELLRTYAEMAPLDPNVMVQERIGGGDDGLYGFLAYYDGEGRCLAWLTKRKLRQNPPIYGDGSLQVSVIEPRVEALSRRLLEAFNFTGLVGVEYKLDPRDGEFKLIEINPRSVSGNMLALACGVDLPYIAYADLCGIQVDAPPRFREGVRLVNELWDFRSFRAYRSMGRIGVGRWLRQVLGRDTAYAYYARDDPVPFLELLRRTLREGSSN